MKFKSLLPLLILMSGVLMLCSCKPTLSTPSGAPTDEDKSKKFAYLQSHRVQVPLKADHYPVFIFRDATMTATGLNGVWRGSGTALMKDGKPMWMISAAHCFQETGIYHITIVTPDMTPSIWGIESIRREGKTDVVMAKIGPSPILIQGIPSHLPSLERNTKAKMSSISEPRSVRSQITGKRYNLVGTVKFDADPDMGYYILDYSCTLAESGCTFVDDTGVIIVLNGFMMPDERALRQLGIPVRSGYFSYATEVKFKWP